MALQAIFGGIALGLGKLALASLPLACIKLSTSFRKFCWVSTDADLEGIIKYFSLILRASDKSTSLLLITVPAGHEELVVIAFGLPLLVVSCLVQLRAAGSVRI